MITQTARILKPLPNIHTTFISNYSENIIENSTKECEDIVHRNKLNALFHINFHFYFTEEILSKLEVLFYVENSSFNKPHIVFLNYNQNIPLLSTCNNPFV